MEDYAAEIDEKVDCSGTIQENTDHTWEFAGRNLIQKNSCKRILKVIKPEDSETHLSVQLQRASNIPCAGDLNRDIQLKARIMGETQPQLELLPKAKKKKKEYPGLSLPPRLQFTANTSIC